jgi:hypothetical protein
MGDACALSASWSPPVDAGLGSAANQSLLLNYSLRLIILPFPLSPLSAATCAGLDLSSASPSWSNDALTATTEAPADLTRGTIYCVALRARNDRLARFSPAASAVIRPLGPPAAPAQLALTVNPLNWTNLSAARTPALVTWLPPSDRGGGPGQDVVIGEYGVEVTACDGAVKRANTTATALAVELDYRCNYTVKVDASNMQASGVSCEYVGQCARGDRLRRDVCVCV